MPKDSRWGQENTYKEKNNHPQGKSGSGHPVHTKQGMEKGANAGINGNSKPRRGTH